MRKFYAYDSQHGHEYPADGEFHVFNDAKERDQWISRNDERRGKLTAKQFRSYTGRDYTYTLHAEDGEHYMERYDGRDIDHGNCW